MSQPPAGTLSANVMHFARLLRRAGLPVGPSDMLAAQQAATKGWRWVGEMEQIAATFRSAGLPDGFGRAAAAIYAGPARDEAAAADARTLAVVLRALLDGPGPD